MHLSKLEKAGSCDYLTQLQADGYCIIRDAMPVDAGSALACDLEPTFRMATPSQGPFYGNDTKRLGGLLSRSSHAASFVQHGGILDIVQTILSPWCDHISLNLTQAIELMPGSIEQVPHRDQDMWPCSRLVDQRAHVEFLVNVMWPLSPFTAENGATRIWPSSHRRPDEVLIDRNEAVAAEMEPGAALLFLGSTLHAGGANQTRAPRRGMIISYCLGWLKPYELQWLVYPPSVASQFSADLAALAGYRVHRPNLGNVEGQCPSRLLTGSPLPASGAVDWLGPEQHDIISEYRRSIQ